MTNYREILRLYSHGMSISVNLTSLLGQFEPALPKANPSLPKAFKRYLQVLTLL
jgi:hypothetical protein